MFEKFNFSEKQIERYYKSAKKDIKIAGSYSDPEVSFRFSYDSLLKLAIAVCAKNGMRVKSKRGHHRELIGKLASFLDDNEINIIANEMRGKRNRELYDGGILISLKESKSYLKWTKNVFNKAEKIFGK
jgi:hypothetical protein